MADGLESPAAMEIAPDGRVFVCEQGGALRIVRDDTLLPAPCMSLGVNSEGERGLLGVAFDPDFLSNQFFYLYYTVPSPFVHNRISRFTMDGDSADPASEVVLLDLDELGSTIHNGGALHFGPDGKLYAAVGENARPNEAHKITSFWGKMLRLERDGTIPADNPFADTAEGKYRAIWALGLRNPFTFAFRSGEGTMYINDVGQDAWEEVDVGVAGANYGWPDAEGPSSDSRYISPLFAYGHGEADSFGCAISGGAFFDSTVMHFPGFAGGDYFFADYCGGWIRALHPADSSAALFASGISSPVDLKASPEGALLYLARGNDAATGTVWKIQYEADLGPVISSGPMDLIVSDGAPASFSVIASGEAPLAYQWERDGSPADGDTAPVLSLAAAHLADNGSVFRCIVTNAFGADTSGSATLTVTDDTPPQATIVKPLAGSKYSAGDTVRFSGTGSDPEQGNLPASAFSWRVDFHHDAHVHPFVPAASGFKTGSFGVPATGETSDQVWYRIILTVTDSSGLKCTAVRDVVPRTSVISLATTPPGLRIALDGTPHATPYTFTGVVGMERTLEALTPQDVAGETYTFAAWSDSGMALHTISTPSESTSYTAMYTGPLAVQLLELRASQTGPQRVVVEWTTVGEIANYGFYIERKSPGTAAFAGVSGLVPGAGTSLEEHRYEWTDSTVHPGSYSYRIRHVDYSGNSGYSPEALVEVSGVLDARSAVGLPKEFSLRQNHPNPFNPSTSIRYDLPEAGRVVLAVYDVLGRRTALLVDEHQDAGAYPVLWEARGEPTGVYFYALAVTAAGGRELFSARKTMLLVK